MAAQANPLDTFLQNVFGVPAEQVTAHGKRIYKEVNDNLKWLDHHIDAFVEDHFPESTHQVAMSVIRSIPETFVCAAVFSGVGVVPALLYWGAKVVKISWPFLKEFMSLQFNQQAVGAAAGQSLKDLFDSYKSFYPAIGVCASVAAVISFVFGWVTNDYSMMIRSTIYGVVAQLAFAALTKEPSVAGNERLPQPPGGDRLSDSLDTSKARASAPARAEGSAAPSEAVASSASMAASSSSSSSLAGASVTVSN